MIIQRKYETKSRFIVAENIWQICTNYYDFTIIDIDRPFFSKKERFDFEHISAMLGGKTRQICHVREE